MQVKFTIGDIRSELKNYKGNDRGGYAECPVCGDDHHLHISVMADGSVKMFCFKCQKTKEIYRYFAARLAGYSDYVQKVDVKRQKVAGDRRGKRDSENHGLLIERIEYEYTDSGGKVLYYKLRLKYADGSKRFLMYQNVAGKKIYKRPDNAPALYNMSGMMRANTDCTLYIVEGEKCAKYLIDRNVVATTAYCGAQQGFKFTDADVIALCRFKRAVLLPDNDDVGQRLIAAYKAIRQDLEVVKICDYWPECPHKGDIADYIDAGLDWKVICHD